MPSEPQHIGKLLTGLIEHSRRRAEAARAAAGAISEAEATIRRDAEKKRKAGVLAHLEACGVDAITREAFRGEKLRRTVALAGVLEWLASDKPFCVLAGGVGAGKSVAGAYALLKATRKVRMLAHPLADEPVEFEELDPRGGLFTTAARLRHSERYTEGKVVSLMDRAATVKWLVLDELREADAQGAGQARLEEVLGERYAMARRTVITTNLPQQSLAALLKERLSSRLAEGAMVVDAGDADLRRGEVAP